MANSGGGYANADGNIIFVLAPERHIRFRAGRQPSLDDGLLIDRKYDLSGTALFIGPLGRLNCECIPRNCGDAPGHGLELRRLCGDGSFLPVEKRSMIPGNRRNSRPTGRTHGHCGVQSAERIHKDLRATPHSFDALGVAADGLYGRGESCTAVQAKAEQILPMNHQFYKDRPYSAVYSAALGGLELIPIRDVTLRGCQSPHGIQGARLPGATVFLGLAEEPNPPHLRPFRKTVQDLPGYEMPGSGSQCKSRVSRTCASLKRAFL